MKILYKNLLFTLFITITSGQIVRQNEETNRNLLPNFNQPNKSPINDYTFRDERKDKKVVNNIQSIVDKNKLSEYMALKSTEREQEQKQPELVEKPIQKNYYENIKKIQNNRKFEPDQPEKPMNYNLNKGKLHNIIRHEKTLNKN